MKNLYRLQIAFEPSLVTYNALGRILELEPSDLGPLPGESSKEIPAIWQHEVEEDDSDSYFDFIAHFSDRISAKSEELNKLGIDRESISVWLLYGYKGQCNLEFDPLRLKKLADNGITLCISCWEENE